MHLDGAPLKPCGLCSTDLVRTSGSPVALSERRGAGPVQAELAELAAGLPDQRHLIHGDLVNRNVLVQGTGSPRSSTGATRRMVTGRYDPARR